MNRSVRQRFAAAAAALGVTACDPAPAPGPEAVVSPPIEPPRAEALDPAAPAAAKAIAEAVRDEDAYARVRRLALLLPTLGPEGIPGVTQTLRDPTLNPGGAEIELLVRFWASHEPAEATRWAVQESPPGYRSSAIFSSLTLWAAADPQAALAAEQEWEKQPGVPDAVQSALVYGWFERDPFELVRHIQRLEMGFGRQRALAVYVRLLLQRQGPVAAMRWAESVPEDDPGYKLDVVRQTAIGLPSFDLDAALRWCEAHCDGPHGKDLRGIIAVRWVQLGGGAAALAWLASAPESAERNGALTTVFWEWGRLAPEEASAWIAARSGADDAEPWLPLLYPTYARLLMRDSPGEAIEWAERVEGEQARELLLILVAQAWRGQDEAAAEAWLRESPLSEEARERARGVAPVRGRPAQ